MKVVVNGEDRELSSGATVADLVDTAEVGNGRGVAVAINGEVVSRGDWSDTALSENDRVEVLRAIGGGA